MIMMNDDGDDEDDDADDDGGAVQFKVQCPNAVLASLVLSSPVFHCSPLALKYLIFQVQSANATFSSS